MPSANKFTSMPAQYNSANTGWVKESPVHFNVVSAYVEWFLQYLARVYWDYKWHNRCPPHLLNVVALPCEKINYWIWAFSTLLSPVVCGWIWKEPFFGAEMTIALEMDRYCRCSKSAPLVAMNAVKHLVKFATILSMCSCDTSSETVFYAAFTHQSSLLQIFFQHRIILIPFCTKNWYYYNYNNVVRCITETLVLHSFQSSFDFLYMQVSSRDLTYQSRSSMQ